MEYGTSSAGSYYELATSPIFTGRCMAQEKPNPLFEWLDAMRAQVPVLRRHGWEWVQRARSEQHIIWETAGIRYATYLLVGVIILLSGRCTERIIAPVPVESAPGATVLADFHVMCSDPNCAHHFVIQRKMSFSGFPVKCSKCEKETAVHARRCFSKTCRGRWCAPIEHEGKLSCSRCDEVIELNP